MRKILLLAIFTLISKGIDAAPRFVPSQEGTEVQDLKTGLIWNRCSVGQLWNGVTCSGFAQDYTFESALMYAKAIRAESGSMWRIPNIKELQSISIYGRDEKIDGKFFPNTPIARFWSATPYIQDAAYALIFDFTYGNIMGLRIDATSKLRLVRDAQ